MGNAPVTAKKKRRSDAVYTNKAEKQRAYRRRKAKQRSDGYIAALGRDPGRFRRLTFRDYGSLGNAVKAQMADERRGEPQELRPFGFSGFVD